MCTVKRALGIALLLAAAAFGGRSLLARRQGAASAFRLDARVPSSGPLFSSALRQTVGVGLKPGHRIELILDGRVFDALTAAIARARESVHVDIYMWTDGAASRRVIEALRARAKGVACRVVVDAEGSSGPSAQVASALRDAGCELRVFRPSSHLTARNHRKIVVVDGRVGFTGGFGIDDRWLGEAQDENHWRDTSLRVEGPAVGEMQAAFGEDWQEAGGALLPPEAFPDLPAVGPSRAAFVASVASPVVTRAERLSQLAIDASHDRLWISNAYFVPGRPVLDLLAQRSAQGVDVRVLVPGRKSDSKSSFVWQQREYKELLKVGTRIWEFQPSMMHAKTMVIDSTIAIVGSVNLDPLSLDRLEEGALVVEDREVALELARAFERDCARAREER
ncbi:MAG: phospholipase D-like domain-containing protein [Myxococcales bacterium]